MTQFSWSGVYPGALAWSPDNKRLAVGLGGSAPSVLIFGMDAGKQIASFGDYTIKINGLAWSPDGHYLAGTISGSQNTLQIWDPADTSTELLSYVGLGDLGLAWSPDNKLLAVTSSGKRSSRNLTPNGGIALYTTGSWTQVFSMPTVAIITGASWSPDGKRLAFAANVPDASNVDSTGLKVLDIASKQVEQIGEPQNGFTSIVSWAPSGNFIALQMNYLDARPGEVLIADVVNRRLVQRIKGDVTVNSLSWSPIEDWIAVAGFSRNMRVWDARTGKLVDNYYHDSTTSDNIFEVAWSPDGRLIATLVSDDTLWIWKAPR